MINNTDLTKQILHSDRLRYFCRWLAEVWSTRGLDVVLEMLEKPYNWRSEWNEYNWLCERFDTVSPECTKDDMDECETDFA